MEHLIQLTPLHDGENEGLILHDEEKVKPDRTVDGEKKKGLILHDGEKEKTGKKSVKKESPRHATSST